MVLFCINFFSINLYNSRLYKNGHKPLPDFKSPLLTDSVSKLSSKIQNGSISIEDLVKVFIERIQ